MSTHIIACLMLYRHRQVRVTPFILLIRAFLDSLLFFYYILFLYAIYVASLLFILKTCKTTLPWIIAVRYCHLTAYSCHDSTNPFWPVLHVNDLRIFSWSRQNLNIVDSVLLELWFLKCFCFFCSLISGRGAFQAGGGLFQHEGGDPVKGFWPWLFGELGRCGHAGTSPAGKLRECNQQCESQRGVDRRSQSDCTSTVWAQLLQQWPFPRLHFWCNHRYVEPGGEVVLCDLLLLSWNRSVLNHLFVCSLQYPVTTARADCWIRVGSPACWH